MSDYIECTPDGTVARRVTDPDPATVNRATVLESARQAAADNRTFIALASPTNAQNAAQVKALTRQVDRLIRLVLDQLDGTD